MTPDPLEKVRFILEIYGLSCMQEQFLYSGFGNIASTIHFSQTGFPFGGLFFSILT